MEVFLQGRGWDKKLIAKDQKEFDQARSPSLRDKGRGSYQMHYLTFVWEMDRVHVTDYHVGADQKIPD